MLIDSQFCSRSDSLSLSSLLLMVSQFGKVEFTLATSVGRQAVSDMICNIDQVERDKKVLCFSVVW